LSEADRRGQILEQKPAVYQWIRKMSATGKIVIILFPVTHRSMVKLGYGSKGQHSEISCLIDFILFKPIADEHRIKTQSNTYHI
jgi:hypothetical protein